MIGPLARALSDEEFEDKVARIPVPRAAGQVAQRAQGLRAGAARRGDAQGWRIGSEARGAARGKPWLAGVAYTLADICNFAIVNGMQHGFAELVNAADTPHLLAWIERINDRPACRRMFAESQRETLSAEATKADA